MVLTTTTALQTACGTSDLTRRPQVRCVFGAVMSPLVALRGPVSPGALASVVAIAAANVPAAAQQQSGQISEARRAGIERCVQQAHQEAMAQGPGSGEQQQRFSYTQTAWLLLVSSHSTTSKQRVEH